MTARAQLSVIAAELDDMACRLRACASNYRHGMAPAGIVWQDGAYLLHNNIVVLADTARCMADADGAVVVPDLEVAA